MLDKSKIKLFRMNDYDWVAAETAEQANEWYIKLTGINPEDNPLDEVVEEPLDKVFLSEYDDLDEDELKMNFKQKTIGQTVYIEIPFSYTLSKKTEIKEPIYAGSTEW